MCLFVCLLLGIGVYTPSATYKKIILCNWVAKIEVQEFDIITIMLGMPELLMEKKENSGSQFFGDA